MKEIWKDIKNYEGLYQVSNMGNVRSLDHYVDHGRWKNHKKVVKGKPLKFKLDKDGYCVLALYKNGSRSYRRVHRLVAEAFIPNLNNYTIVNHINEIKNDNRAENLEWCTIEYNNNYGTKNQRSAKSNIGKHNRKVRCITTGKEFNSLQEAGDYYNCNLQARMCKISGTKKTCGKLPDGTPLQWEYID